MNNPFLHQPVDQIGHSYGGFIREEARENDEVVVIVGGPLVQEISDIAATRLDARGLCFISRESADAKPSLV